MKKKYIILNTITQETFEYTGPWKTFTETVVFLDICGTVMETTATFKYDEFDEQVTAVSDTYTLLEVIEA